MLKVHNLSLLWYTDHSYRSWPYETIVWGPSWTDWNDPASHSQWCPEPYEQVPLSRDTKASNSPHAVPFGGLLAPALKSELEQPCSVGAHKRLQCLAAVNCSWDHCRVCMETMQLKTPDELPPRTVPWAAAASRL